MVTLPLVECNKNSLNEVELGAGRIILENNKRFIHY